MLFHGKKYYSQRVKAVNRNYAKKEGWRIKRKEIHDNSNIIHTSKLLVSRITITWRDTCKSGSRNEPRYFIWGKKSITAFSRLLPARTKSESNRSGRNRFTTLPIKSALGG